MKRRTVTWLASTLVLISACARPPGSVETGSGPQGNRSNAMHGENFGAKGASGPTVPSATGMDNDSPTNPTGTVSNGTRPNVDGTVNGNAPAQGTTDAAVPEPSSR